MIVLVPAASLRLGDRVIPEEYDVSLQPADYDESFAVEVVAITAERGYQRVTVRYVNGERETWTGYPMQELLVVR